MQRHVTRMKPPDVAIGQLDEQRATVVDAGRLAHHRALPRLHADAAVQ